MAGDAPKTPSFRYFTEPQWYLWDGGFLLVAKAEGEIPPHAHHAIQIVFGLDGSTAIRGKHGDWRMGRGIVVRPDAVHSFNASGSLGAMLFVDPESTEGGWLLTALKSDITLVPDARLSSPAAELRALIEHPIDSMDPPSLIRHCVQALTPGAPPARRLDERVTKVLGRIRSSDELRISLGMAADMAFLSPSRFAHLFKQQMGLPFSRYMLWRKLTRAMLAVGSGRSIADAAHAADFADSAHLTRTFHQMFGITPSAFMRGVFSEIDSPFDVMRQSKHLTEITERTEQTES